jgi:hypothetical protein
MIGECWVQGAKCRLGLGGDYNSGYISMEYLEQRTCAKENCSINLVSAVLVIVREHYKRYKLPVIVTTSHTQIVSSLRDMKWNSKTVLELLVLVTILKVFKPSVLKILLLLLSSLAGGGGGVGIRLCSE